MKSDPKQLFMIKVMERFKMVMKITTPEILRIIENGNYPRNPIKKEKVVRSLNQALGQFANGIKTQVDSQAVWHKKDLEKNRIRDDLFLKYRTEEKEWDTAYELNMMKMTLEFQWGTPIMPQEYDQCYQMYNSPYIWPQPSPLSNPLLIPPTNQII